MRAKLSVEQKEREAAEELMKERRRPNPNPSPSPSPSPSASPNPNQVGYVCRIVSFNVGVVVCISLPLVSLWANLLGAALPLLAARLRRNPAVTSAPLMTTIIDSTGLYG